MPVVTNGLIAASSILLILMAIANLLSVLIGLIVTLREAKSR